MKMARFSEHQIVAILKEVELGLPVGDMIRKVRHRLVRLLQVEARKRRVGCLGAQAAQGANGATAYRPASVRNGECGSSSSLE